MSASGVPLAACLAVSAALHLIVAGVAGFKPHGQLAVERQVLRVSIQTPSRGAGEPRVYETARPDAGRVPPPGRTRLAIPDMAVQAAPMSAPDANLAQRPPRTAPQLRVAEFDPAVYLAPSQVERVALPINEELFDYLPLTGFSAGYWLLRLYIDESGKLDEMEVVEVKASTRNTDDLRAILSASRFQPASTKTATVKSQRMIEISFEPGPPAASSAPAPILAAGEK